MPEEEKLEDDFSAVDDIGGGRRKGGLLGFIPDVVIKILKWLFIVIALVMMMVLISFIVTQATSSSQGAGGLIFPQSPNSSIKPPQLDWYQQLDDIRTRTSDPDPAMIIIKVNIGYEKEDTQTLTELINRKPRIEDAIRQYLSSQSEEELGNEEVIKREMKDNLNRIMNTERIKDITFKTFDIINM